MARQPFRPEQLDRHWPRLLSLLPLDLEERARQTGALRRCRQVPNAVALVRLIMIYAASNLPLKGVVAWAAAQGTATLSAPGLFYRLRLAEPLLAELLAGLLPALPAPESWRLRVTDATVVTGPGAHGTDWRVHVLYEPATGAMSAVQLTDQHGGEHFRRWQCQPGELVLGDRGYAHARGIQAVCEQGGHVLVRINPRTLRLCDQQRRLVDVQAWKGEVPEVGVKEWQLLLPVPPERHTKSHKSWSLAHAVAWVPVRLLAARTPHGGIIWLLTTAPAAALSATRALELYRLRWQIELFFKRLKSLLWFDQLPTRAGPTARAWLLGRLLLDASDANADEAKAHFDKALALAPKDVDAKIGSARVKALKGDFDGAVATLEDAAKLNPKPEKVHYQLGLVYEKAGKNEQAAEAYRKALERLLHE